MLLYLSLENSQYIVDQSEVIIALKTGNIKTFEMIFKQYYQPLVNYGYTILQDRDEAEDIVQHTFVSFWEQRENNEIHTSLRSMLYKAVHNACLNNLKHRKVRNVYKKHQEYNHETTNKEFDTFQAQELEERIEEIVKNLPEQCARVFRMSRQEGLKYQEIANQLGLSIKTIENQMGKALRILREELKVYLPLFILFLIQDLS